jgi:hypothetical protein
MLKMTKSNVSKLIKNVQMMASKHSPEILTGIGIAGMITTTVLAVKATPKALTLLEEAEQEKGESLTVMEKTKTCWKCYIPAAVTGLASTACLVGASSVNAKRNAALAAAYTLSDSALREYRDKVVETIGEKKEQTIRDKVAEERIKKNPVSKNEIFITDKGNTLCYDAISGRYFKSDIEKIKRAENELNKRMLDDMYISLNEFYDEIGLSHTSLGDELGWNIDDGLLDFDFSAQLAEDDTPCLVVDYRIAPKYNFSSFR